ncbi:MAG: SOS response-associated peptidase [Opitutaceae bacterium]|nr:SOS response-associated peptidase [Opitutaceae bacterium]
MCGRYTITNPEALRGLVQWICEGEDVWQETAPRWNIHPEDTMAIVHRSVDAGCQVKPMRWGLVPFWEKSSKPKLAPINARSGEAFAKPFFRQAIQKRRCLVPADGFYEWPKQERTGRAPRHPNYYTLTDHRPFFFAGIFETAVEGLRPDTFTLFTTAPNSLLLALPHERMPVILESERAKEWIRPGPISEPGFLDLCRTFPADQMTTWRVSTLVNKPGNEGPECAAPLDAGGSDQASFGF